MFAAGNYPQHCPALMSQPPLLHHNRVAKSPHTSHSLTPCLTRLRHVLSRTKMTHLDHRRLITPSAPHSSNPWQTTPEHMHTCVCLFRPGCMRPLKSQASHAPAQCVPPYMFTPAARAQVKSIAPMCSVRRLLTSQPRLQHTHNVHVACCCCAQSSPYTAYLSFLRSHCLRPRKHMNTTDSPTNT